MPVSPPTFTIAYQSNSTATRWNGGTIYLKISRPNSQQPDVDIAVPYGLDEPYSEALRLEFEEILSYHLIRYEAVERMLDRLSIFVRVARSAAQDEGRLPRSINFTITDYSPGAIPTYESVNLLREMETTKRMANETEATSKCSICIEDLGMTEHINKLNCGHIFHSECIITWFATEIICPICRSVFI